MKTLRYATVALLMLWAVTALAVGTSSTSTSAASLIDQGIGVYDTFRSSGVLAGITAVVYFLVTLSKVGAINAWIKAKKAKWLRPALAVTAGFLAGLGVGLGQGQSVGQALMMAVMGVFSGGTAVAVHELLACFQGEREKEEPVPLVTSSNASGQ